MIRINKETAWKNLQDLKLNNCKLNAQFGRASIRRGRYLMFYSTNVSPGIGSFFSAAITDLKVKPAINGLSSNFSRCNRLTLKILFYRDPLLIFIIIHVFNFCLIHSIFSTA